VLLQRMGYSHQAQITNCGNQLDLRIKCDNSMFIQCWRKLPADTGFQLIHTYQPTADYGYQSLSFTDDLTTVSASTIQYRYVMQIGTDTTYTLDEFSSNWDGCPVPPASDRVEVLPNPFTGILQVRTSQTNASNQILFVLSNEAGQVVFRSQATQTVGTQTHQFNLSHLAKGIYFLKVYYNERKMTTQKVVRG
ncbi:MAG TPA: T9SS type A sorting domain-containing protein, partial [Ferruginibacter sp.]|nr:T9SS type A sorting domain-containing protein [Ferruginibacter sp.]